MSERKPLTLEELREAPHGKIKDETLRHICDRANEIAAEPHRLDRSAWEPCAWCAGKACANCSRAETPSCNTCKTCKEHNHWEPDSKFCPDCGRPRTDAAWEMLEKRLEGRQK